MRTRETAPRGARRLGSSTRRGSFRLGRAASFLAAIAIGGSGCLTILGDFDGSGGATATAASSSSAASSGDAASTGGDAASSTGSAMGGAGPVSTSASSSSTGAGGEGGGGAGGAGGASGAGGAGGGGPVVKVSCNNKPCEDGMICCHKSGASNPDQDVCGKPGQCGGDKVEIQCDDASDCGGTSCCGSAMFTTVTSMQCKTPCVPQFSQNSVFVACKDSAECPMETPTCKPITQLGSGYNFCDK